MAYTINLTDGTIFATIADGTINTSSNMVLVGKNYAGYGEFLDENFIHLLENASNTTPPTAPLDWSTLVGQSQWIDEGIQWLRLSKLFRLQLHHPLPQLATCKVILWYDTVNAQLKVWTGTAWLLVGPQFTAGHRHNRRHCCTITDNTSVSHVVIELYVENAIVGIVSKDAAFTPQVSYTRIYNSATRYSIGHTVGHKFRCSKAQQQMHKHLIGIDSTQFLLSEINDTTTGTLGVLNNTGLTVGVNQDFRIGVTGTQQQFLTKPAMVTLHSMST
jgi:hypothetical protein